MGGPRDAWAEHKGPSITTHGPTFAQTELLFVVRGPLTQGGKKTVREVIKLSENREGVDVVGEEP